MLQRVNISILLLEMIRKFKEISSNHLKNSKYYSNYQTSEINLVSKKSLELYSNK